MAGGQTIAVCVPGLQEKCCHCQGNGRLGSPTAQGLGLQLSGEVDVNPALGAHGLYDACAPGQHPRAEQCQMPLKQLDMPEGGVMMVNDVRSPAICGAGLWPCCAARGACNSNHPMLTGFWVCVCLCATCGLIVHLGSIMIAAQSNKEGSRSGGIPALAQRPWRLCCQLGLLGKD